MHNCTPSSHLLPNPTLCRLDLCVPSPPRRAGISAIRRLRKTDNNRIARACGATIVNRTEEIRESDIGTAAGLFEVSGMGFMDALTSARQPSFYMWA